MLINNFYYLEKVPNNMQLRELQSEVIDLRKDVPKKMKELIELDMDMLKKNCV